jgi:hypothetical protein
MNQSPRSFIKIPCDIKTLSSYMLLFYWGRLEQYKYGLAGGIKNCSVFQYINTKPSFEQNTMHTQAQNKGPNLGGGGTVGSRLEKIAMGYPLFSLVCV